MGLLKAIARVPWNLMKPVRERVVFRLLHYGRLLLQPLETAVGAIEERQRALTASVSSAESRLAALDEVRIRLLAVEAKLAILGEIEGRPSALDAIEHRLSALGAIEHRLSALGEIEHRLSALGEIEGRLSALDAVEHRLSALGAIEGRLSALDAIEHRLSALGAIDGRLGGIESGIGSTSGHVEDAVRALREQGEQLALVDVGLQAVFRDLARGRLGAERPDLSDAAPENTALDVRFSPAGRPLRAISYARSREDILLARLFPEDHEGFYVDAGAGDPTVFSGTRLFYDRGWRGINVEPSRPLFDRLVEQRSRDINLNIGLWSAEAELTFYESQDESGPSSFLEGEATRARERGSAVRSRMVKAAPLAKVLDAWEVPGIDFLKVDAGGAELEVLRGNDWARFRPRVLIVAVRRVEEARPEDAGDWSEEGEALLSGAGYTFATFDGLNRFYVRNEDAAWVDALEAPPNVSDNFVPYEVVAGREEQQSSRVEAAGDPESDVG